MFYDEIGGKLLSKKFKYLHIQLSQAKMSMNLELFNKLFYLPICSFDSKGVMKNKQQLTKEKATGVFIYKFMTFIRL